MDIDWEGAEENFWVLQTFYILSSNTVLQVPTNVKLY